MILVHHLLCLSPLAVIMHLALANHGQRDVCQLHEVATGSHTSVFGNERIDAEIDEVDQQVDDIGVRPNVPGAMSPDGLSLPISRTRRPAVCLLRGMTSDDVVLQIFEILVVYAPLGHGSESGVYAIDDFVFGKVFEKFITNVLPHLFFGRHF